MSEAPQFPPGSIVAWWSRSSVEVSRLDGYEKHRARIVLANGRNARIPPQRIFARIDGPPAAEGDVGAAARRLDEMAHEVDVAALWEVATEAFTDPGTAAFDLAALAELGLGRDGGAERAATARALVEEGLHFVRRGELWEARPPAAVEELAAERRRIAERERERAVLMEGLARAGRGEPFEPTGSDVERRVLGALEHFAVHEDATPEPARAAALDALAASGLRHDRPHEGAFRLLRRLGRFEDDDENLQLRRFPIRTAFPVEVLERASAAAARGGGAEVEREDLVGWTTISIDQAHTREIDDCLSAEERAGGGWRLGIHIADPGAFVEPGDPVDREALARAVTHYFPERRWTMLPPAISEDAASLAPGLVRPAVSLLAEVDARGEILEYRFARTRIRSEARVDYDEADETLRAGRGRFAELLQRLDAWSALRELRRAADGAILLRLPEVDIHVAEDRTIALERLEGGSPARRAVTEAMVLAGELAAKLCHERSIPAIYRRQEVGEGLPALGPDRVVEDPVLARAVLRVLRRGEVGLRPGPHRSLGLALYSQVTSPLRRFADLAMQRQVAAAAAGTTPPYDAAALQRIAAATEQGEGDARRAERASRDYWILRHLERFEGATLEALVVESEPRPLVQLRDCLWTQPAPGLGEVAPGAQVEVRVERVNPRAGLLVLRPV